MVDNGELMLKNIFSYLLDSVSYIIDKKSNIAEADTIRYNIENTKNEMENIKSDIRNIMETYDKKFDHKNFQTYSERINENAATNLDLFFAGLRAEMLMDNEKIDARIKNDDANATKNVCEFLRQTTSIIKKKSIRVSNNKGIIHLILDYTCMLDIEYAFSIELIEGEFFKAPYFSSLGYGAEIPIKIERDKIYNEDIGRYSLENVEIEGNKMTVLFAGDDNGHRISFESVDFQITAIKFDNGIEQVDIVSNPDLYENLNRESTINALKKLYKIVMEVEDNKGELLHLTFQGKDILREMNVDDFMEGLLSTDYVKNLVKNVPDTSDNADQITRSFIINRINTLENESERYKKILFS